ncbi:MAG: VOC family protein [Bacteroidia bacterium]|nr:VOC family protein [Bacteroidia bacterium]NNF31206.1 VOC family protein [Flavobacteriaceae bacterium]MBT8274801.1 VOC family protein [Bacteroidia bacterium]NNJ82512.1 VOC family protein [Flavobacteriaceae bacterium]NNK54636.1 VOC family protein [Flavobacteriaceae bacterium]
MEHNIFAWVEIPVTDMNRAINFYEAVLDVELKLVDFGGVQMGWFPFSENAEAIPGATGTLIKHETYIPSQEGTLVYIHSKDVQIELDRIEAAGGTIYQPKTQISPEHGFMGVFIDSEGNRVALHSRN